MKQFEYLVNSKLFFGDNRAFNELGKQGWELVNFTSDGRYIFKRELFPEYSQERQRHTQYDGYDR